MNYQEALNFIHTRNKFGIKLGLDATNTLLEKIGNPHRRLKFIHIAGTNGKGSTTSYIHDILMKSGFKTGKFISPYVYSFTERIQINNREIPEDDLAECVAVVKDAIDKYSLTPTEFEVVTAVGLLYFERQKCDYVVLEVGMGGRFDATNVIPTPLVSVITSISIDHTEYLGNTISDIAFEKCGIIKSGSKTVAYIDNPEDADAVIKKTCIEKDVPLTIPDKNNIRILSQGIEGTDFEYKSEKYHINMLGKHQVYNAVSAVEAARLLGIKEEFIKQGLEHTRFRGRLEIVSKNPLILEDGAHNYSGVLALCDGLKTYFADKKIIIVMAMLKDKEYERCIETLSSVADIFITTEANNPRKTTADELLQTAGRYIKNVYAEPDVNKAVTLAKSMCNNDGVICVCGSLYLLGDVQIQKGQLK